MSRSRNVWSKYAYVPEHVQVSINTKASATKQRARYTRGRDKQVTRAIVTSILQGTERED
jgi:hypothetical protein